MKDFLKKHSSTILLALLELLVGILLLIQPVGFTKGIIICCGIIAILIGLKLLIGYFKVDPVTASQGHLLFGGLGLLSAGLFASFNSDWIIALFPIVTILYGIGIFISGLYKVQVAVDLHRLKLTTPLWAGISAAGSLIFSLIIIFNPFTGVTALWIFISIVLIIAAVFDIAAIFLSERQIKQ